MSGPLVSCIMPTQGARARFVPQSIWYFLRQAYEHRELVVVDDPDGAIADLIPDDARIRYTQLSERLPLGAKRNVGCEAARGDVIIHWDDDDWVSPYRLSVQVAALERSGARACGCTDLLHYALDDGEAWLYRHRPDGSPWVAGCTLAYRRAAWEERAFPALPVGEDSAWIRELDPDSVLAIDDTGLLVAVVHGGNTASKYFPDPHWERRDFGDVARLIGADSDFYAALRNGKPVAPRPARHWTESAVNLYAPFAVWDGYGSVAEHLALGMAREGARVAVVPTMLDREGLSAELCELIDRSRPVAGAAALLFGVAIGNPREAFGKELFVNTMWEADRLPATWIQPLNTARAVIVPTRFVARAARASGVTVPIEVVPEGVDPAIYPYVDRPEREGLTTLTVGLLNARKHVREAIDAWKLAFADDPEARLIVKARFQLGGWEPDDPRITLVDENQRTRGIMHLYEQADILLQLGNEGFGLPLVEGMATGLPAVALVSEGHGDIREDAPDCLLPVEPDAIQICDDTQYGPAGVRGVPDVGQAARQLRWIADHRDDARAMGRRASEWVHAERNIWAKAPAVLDVMERHRTPPRPLRPRPIVWAPHESGADDLVAALGVRRAADGAPAIDRITIAHVVHVPAAIDDQELTRFVLDARTGGVPVAVTELAPSPELRAWERDATVLVAHTRRGAQLLRSKWPTARVELIPPGCPPWAGDHRAGRRRRGPLVVATFAEEPACLTAALEAAVELGGELLVLGCRAGDLPSSFADAAAAAGVAVRVQAPEPAGAAARRIAARADVVVLWHEERDAPIASGAARTALASGVPVLGAASGALDGLADCVHTAEAPGAGARRVIEDDAVRRSLAGAARNHCNDNRWPRIAERYRALWRELEGR